METSPATPSILVHAVVSSMLARLEKGELFFLMAEVGRKVVASSEIHILGGDEKHDDYIGLVISFRGLGIETEMMKTLAEEATA